FQLSPIEKRKPQKSTEPNSLRDGRGLRPGGGHQRGTSIESEAQASDISESPRLVHRHQEPQRAPAHRRRPTEAVELPGALLSASGSRGPEVSARGRNRHGSTRASDSTTQRAFVEQVDADHPYQLYLRDSAAPRSGYVD